MADPTNFILTLCVQRETTVEVIAVAAAVAKAANDWVEIDCRNDDHHRITVGPEGEVLVRVKKNKDDR